MVLLCRDNATINAHVKTQNRVNHRSNTVTRDPETRRPGSICGSSSFCTVFVSCVSSQWCSYTLCSLVQWSVTSKTSTPKRHQRKIDLPNS